MRNRHGGALDEVVHKQKKEEERYSMIYEDPEAEDRESLPIKKPTRDRMKPTIAKDQNTPMDYLFSM
jgi:hypothetical protein